MPIDLSRALHDAAADSTSRRPALATGPVLARIRRRRAGRHAVEGAVGVAAAGAVAVGAVQLTDLRRAEPGPPAVTTPAPSPTPSRTPSPDAAWPVVTPLGDLACALPVPAIDDPAGDEDLHLDLGLFVVPAEGVGAPAVPDAAVPTLVPGERLSVVGDLVNGVPQAFDGVTPPDGRELWVVQDGTVVGRLGELDPPPVADVPGTEFRSTAAAGWGLAPLTGVPVACGPDGEPLPPGDYELYAVQVLEVGAGDAASAPAGGAVLRVVAGPLAFAVAPAPEDDAGSGEQSAPDAPDARPALADLVVTSAGLGPLAIGVAPATNPGAAMIRWDAEACDIELLGGTQPGRWVASGYPDVAVDGQARPPFRVDADDAAVRWIDVVAPGIRTDRGVRIGTVLTELRSAYPELEGPFDGPVSRVWWVSSPTGTLVFETQGDADGLQPAGTPEGVILVRVLAAGTDPAFATANSDFVAGGCL